jgi:hypothetical protein
LKRILNTTAAKGAFYNGTALSELKVGGTSVFMGGGINHPWSMSGSTYSSTNITYTLPGSGAKQNSDGYFVISGGWTHVGNANVQGGGTIAQTSTVTFTFYSGSTPLHTAGTTATVGTAGTSASTTGSFGSAHVLGNGQLLTSVVMHITSSISSCRTDASANITLF